jgi:DNA-binding CsgD family transcriptional regulator
MNPETTQLSGVLRRAVAALLSGPRDADRLKRLFHRSPVPLLLLDDRRRYIDANPASVLALRTGVSDLRRLRADDLVVPRERTRLDTLWGELVDSGRTGGRLDVLPPAGHGFEVVVKGLARALPDLHLAAFLPAGWTNDELAAIGEEPVAALTPREVELLQLAADGLTGPAIAEALVVSPATVRTHFQNIYEKLGVHDRAAAVAKAMRHDLVA